MDISRHLDRSLTPADRYVLAQHALESPWLGDAAQRLTTAAGILDGAASYGTRNSQADAGAALLTANVLRQQADDARMHRNCPFCAIEQQPFQP
jgi:hypothetical protein